MIDCHVHTSRCGHASGNAEEYVREAERAGLDVICFTEHLPLPFDIDPANTYSMPESELVEYLADVARCAERRNRQESHGTPGLKVLAGIEADWLPGGMERVSALIGTHPFDVVLGSVHFIDGWAFDDPGLISQWESADVDATWLAYFEHLVEAANSGLFDVMAHPDLVKKFGHRPSFDTRELYEATAAAFAAAGVAVEVSTAGLRKPVGELYPSADLLASFCRAGVPATLGSDAHAPEEVAFGFSTAREALAQAGYTSLVYFESRCPKEVPL